MDDRTQQLDLTAPIPTGSAKAAAAAAGATSADLWMVPYGQLHYDPSDNIRPVDPEWVTHLTALIIENGYDKGSPLHCYARKVAGKDLLFVYKGQHRYLAAGKAIEAGKDIGKIPVVVRDAKTVNRAEMVIDGYLSNNGKQSSPLDLAAAVAELRDIHGMTLAAICKRLNVTDQTIRDVGLLERAPAELHQLVRNGQCTGTLAIEQIRLHGGDKALERIASGLAKAKEVGKSKVTKKHLACDTKPAKQAAAKATKISDATAKQLLQALQAVLHDPVFGKLSPGTIRAVHTALSPLTDLLDTPQKARIYPVTAPDQDGRCVAADTLRSPNSKRTKKPIAEIYVAQPKADQWICAAMYNFGDSFASTPLKFGAGTTTYATRMQAAQEGARWLKKVLGHENIKRQKDLPIVLQWLDDILQSPDPDWTPDMAQEVAK
ncbi:pyridoxal phosphate biosynthetic protein PdxJ [Burkholderia stabilis]|uniref:ParB/RepB/Spo0J family partition protein n=2 Tax=Burkholderia TaxID=32008 RepID=UPI000851859C|nr:MULTISPECIES: pyridoxal phosphate biosynthetic protein PdxJ [Burkholderia cepacia complex]AOR69072.1 pyridoxal phosphate biosynthetic protein PdxJ [Burkholderia stabilis]MBR8012198.1 pyridoxal phosphate biosynthetic protein PdxJ [Burkholderia vietnamiensis]MDN7441654.1 pyridoxal phosphate biosynthetic protein PdxJ [Burkholderia cepacia]HDR9041318.1 pyridoxal phosphate biosynthetic protein PdxJ [Burkholderia vietnamiensis]HDR9491512.1 pyridoxal phosphate biosynthetic protein PdxJ [Burkholder